MILPVTYQLAGAVPEPGVSELDDSAGGRYNRGVEINEVGVVGYRTRTADTMGVVTSGTGSMLRHDMQMVQREGIDIIDDVVPVMAGVTQCIGSR